MQAIHQAIQDYVNDSVHNPYHLLPCPADPALPQTSANYGKASTDPADPGGYPCPAAGGYGGSPGVNVGGGPGADFPATGGILRINAGARAWPPAGATGAQPPSWGYVRQGAVPVRDLNLANEDIADAYGHMFIYAVSEEEANLPPQPSSGCPSATTIPACFDFPATPPGGANPYFAPYNMPDQSHGAVGIQDENGNSMVTPAVSALYVLISTGRDGTGAYTLDGVQTPCTSPPGGALDVANCNGSSTTYTQAPYSEN